jgi:DNA repair exonuclease SbcCD nuclease subunit
MECESLYLVGDIFDGWRLKKDWYWPQEHSTVIQKLLRMSRKGTKIVYLPGNHDEFMRQFLGHQIGFITLTEEYLHKGVDGKNYIVLHGDRFDLVTMNMTWLSHIGDWAYTILLNANTVIHFIRSFFNLPYWSLSKWAKGKVKEAVKFIGNYEETLTKYVKNKGLGGIICGHIHSPKIREIDGLMYMNCGDWVESCTALVENYDGSFEIIKWRDK